MDNVELESLLKVESSLRPVAVLASDLAAGVRIAPHMHRRGQLLHAIHGVMIVRAPGGSWVVPQGRAVWVPAGVEHEIEAWVRACCMPRYRSDSPAAPAHRHGGG